MEPWDLPEKDFKHWVQNQVPRIPPPRKCYHCGNTDSLWWTIVEAELYPGEPNPVAEWMSVGAYCSPDCYWKEAEKSGRCPLIVSAND